MKPATLYTKSGSINIAYQFFGSGPSDMVYIPGWVSNIDLIWACPSLAEFLQELGKICRVILFDKRGTGLSDRISELSTLEERMGDIRAVMDAVSSEKAILFGHSEGGSVSALFAATYPHRTISLITFGIFARRRYSPDYPWAPTDQERQKVYDMIENNWGSGDMGLETLAPSRADDFAFMDWLAQYFRSGASPSAAMVLTKMNTTVDIVDILPAIRVPVLMMQRRQDIDVKIEEGRFISGKIKHAKLIEMDGDDHLFWAGNSHEILDAMRNFILSIPINGVPQVKLTSFLSLKLQGQITASDALLKSIQGLMRKYKGESLHSDLDTWIISFDGPTKAIHCGLSLLDLGKHEKIKIALLAHILEGPINIPQTIPGKLQYCFDEMLKQSVFGQLLATGTVRNLLAGTGLKFTSTPYTLKSKSPVVYDLFKVTDPASFNHETPGQSEPLQLLGDSFLEDVIRCIDANLDNEQFSLEMLSRELAVSERKLQRKLKVISNKSPSQLISSVRLHRAKELLTTQKFAVSEIAFQTGFSNPSYFSKCFKKEFGITPSSLISEFS